jgi:hypothetical protein
MYRKLEKDQSAPHKGKKALEGGQVNDMIYVLLVSRLKFVTSG